MKEVQVDLDSVSATSPGTSEASKSVAATEEHCLYCFDVLSAKLNGEAPPSPAFADDQECPLFVTWNTLSPRGSTRLRGCIGNFEPQPLAGGLAEYAIIAAMRDHRFSPIQLKELSKLECGVSLLTDFEECKDPYDWTLGTHGVYIHLYEDRHSSSASPKRSKWHLNGAKAKSLIRRGPGVLTATFLPDVATAQGWDQDETLNAAIRKAGWTGTVDEELRQGLRVVRYRSSKATVDYSTWHQRRQSS